MRQQLATVRVTGAAAYDLELALSRTA